MPALLRPREVLPLRPGVYWHKNSKRWIAKIKVHKKEIYLGSYLSEKEAALAYDQACYDHWGPERGGRIANLLSYEGRASTILRVTSECAHTHTSVVTASGPAQPADVRPSLGTEPVYADYYGSPLRHDEGTKTPPCGTSTPTESTPVPEVPAKHSPTKAREIGLTSLVMDRHQNSVGLV
jgi:hypothetical protein